MFKHEKSSLPELVNEFMLYLEAEGFTPLTRERLLAYYKVLIKYAMGRNLKYFNLEIGKEFLFEHHSHRWTDSEKLTPAQNYLQRHIMTLHEFQTYGKIKHKRRIKRSYHLPHFAGVIKGYLDYEQDRGLKESTIQSKCHALNLIFEYFENLGLKSAEDITASHVYGFLTVKSHYSVTTKERYQYLFRNLIKYLHENELCNPELVKLFPVISIHTKNAYPSCFKPDDISKILRCINTDTSGGKRDYLILLLAAGLGIRCGDICRLKTENIDWTGRKIQFAQSKTGDIVSLSITDEIFYALLDYLKNARPKCDFKELLICGTAPVRPFTNRTFYEMLQKYLSAAEMNIDGGQKHGLHSLRSSLASNMLRDGVRLPVISNVLGHKYADTTSIYLKIDLDGLRKSALEVPVL